jgi:hypothetical protein
MSDDIVCGLGIDSLTADSRLDTYPTAGDDACENVS